MMRTLLAAPGQLGRIDEAAAVRSELAQFAPPNAAHFWTAISPGSSTSCTSARWPAQSWDDRGGGTADRRLGILMCSAFERLADHRTRADKTIALNPLLDLAHRR